MEHQDLASESEEESPEKPLKSTRRKSQSKPKRAASTSDESSSDASTSEDEGEGVDGGRAHSHVSEEDVVIKEEELNHDAFLEPSGFRFHDDDSEVEEVFPNTLAPKGQSSKRSASPSFERVGKGKKRRSASAASYSYVLAVSSDEQDTARGSLSPHLRPTTSSFQYEDPAQALSWAPASAEAPIASSSGTSSSDSTVRGFASTSTPASWSSSSSGSYRSSLWPYAPPPLRGGLKVPPAENFWA
ncbi:hypothetical protein C8R46DRAFT_1119882 [Mycena filopes]|nr:hypothetical protein C8R46DRAFT_1119882 [Mycena filopes]